jgi:general secretion pathway protein H
VLIELVAALALMGLLVTLVYPDVPRGTTPTRFRALLANTAVLLRQARTAAIASGGDVYAVFDRRARVLQAGRYRVAIPADVDVTVLAGGRCDSRGNTVDLVFRADGTNCGGVINFSQDKHVFRVRVNWLTGYVEVLQGT